MPTDLALPRPSAADPAGPLRRLLRRHAYWMLIVPAVALMVVFYVVPLLNVLWLSVTVPEPGFGNYAALWENSTIRSVAWTTMQICTITTVLTLVLGYAVAYAMVHVQRRTLSWMMFCVLLSFWLSVLVRAFAWVMLLRTQGPINGVLEWMGVIDRPLRLVRNDLGVIIGMVHFMLPLAILPLFANMSGIDKRLVSAARGLGARPLAAFRLVFLPLSKPGIIAATILVFVFSLGFFITPAILGGGKVVLISEYIQVQFEQTLNWGLATMLSSVLLIAVFLTLALLAPVVNLRQVFGSR